MLGVKANWPILCLHWTQNPTLVFPLAEHYWIGGAFACHGQGRQGLGRRKGEHAMVTVPGHSYFFFSIFCQTRLDFSSSAIVGNHSILYKKCPSLVWKALPKSIRRQDQENYWECLVKTTLKCFQSRLASLATKPDSHGKDTRQLLLAEKCVGSRRSALTSSVSPPTTSSMKPPPNHPVFSAQEVGSWQSIFPPTWAWWWWRACVGKHMQTTSPLSTSSGVRASNYVTHPSKGKWMQWMIWRDFSCEQWSVCVIVWQFRNQWKSNHIYADGHYLVKVTGVTWLIRSASQPRLHTSPVSPETTISWRNQLRRWFIRIEKL